jgi:phosphopantetheinyl transferase
MTLAGYLRECAHRHGFVAAVEETAEVAARLQNENGAFARAILTGEEWPLFGRLRSPKRRIEWLAGRLAARRAFLDHAAAWGGERVRLVPSVMGGANIPPYFLGEPGLNLSISHSHRYAVAVVAAREVGIDIERIEHRPRSLADYFLSEEECTLLEAGSGEEGRDELITRLWTRKEALAKLLRRGGELTFRNLNVLSDRVPIGVHAHAWARLVSGVAEGYCVAIALEAEAGEDEPPHV